MSGIIKQLIVDMFAKNETEIFEFVRHNEQKLRLEESIHLKDAIINDENIEKMKKIIILPSRFTRDSI